MTNEITVIPPLKDKNARPATTFNHAVAKKIRDMCGLNSKSAIPEITTNPKYCL